MAQKIFTDESLITFVDVIKAYTEQCANAAVLNSKEVYIGTNEPTDPSIQVWINTGEDIVMTKSPSQSRVDAITLLATNWTGSDSSWSQVVTLVGITECSKIDLQPSPEQVAIFHEKDVAFTVVNEDGVVTVYATGVRPLQDYTIQCTITEVTTNG